MDGRFFNCSNLKTHFNSFSLLDVALGHALVAVTPSTLVNLFAAFVSNSCLFLGIRWSRLWKFYRAHSPLRGCHLLGDRSIIYLFLYFLRISREAQKYYTEGLNLASIMPRGVRTSDDRWSKFHLCHRPMDSEKYISVSCGIRLNLDCNFSFTINLAPNRISYGAKLIGNSKYNLIPVYFNKIYKRFRFMYRKTSLWRISTFTHFQRRNSQHISTGISTNKASYNIRQYTSYFV